MELITANTEHTKQIYQLVQNTIQTVYPLYYPKEITEFFSSLHSEETIASDIRQGLVKVLFTDNGIAGTGTCEKNHIKRLFVTPGLQKKGYGSTILQQLEKEIADAYDTAVLDSSLAAACFYEHKGYKTLMHKEFSAQNHTVLVYEIMEKRLHKNTSGICYDGKFFAPVTNSTNGEVSSQTIFSYHQDGNILWAKYSGGDILKGHLTGTVSSNGEMDYYYQHVNLRHEMRAGKCHSVPHISDNGKLALAEQWQWLDGDKSEGYSVVREI